MTPTTRRFEVMSQSWSDVDAVPSRWVPPLWAWRWQQLGGYRGVSLKVGPLLVIFGTHRA